MPSLRKVKIEDDYSRKYIHESKVSPQPCKKVKLHGQFFVKQEATDVKGPCGNEKTIGESSNTVTGGKIKLAGDFPQKPKLEPECESFFSHPILVGCRACYRYTVQSNNVCFFCHRRTRTVEELSRE
ncbi:hypothetical protein FCM35_KLT17728 [Carex littledalei]|uniref:Uncharacterized protein n=1 Tax=Carex littledalei TaxID=544730 RepID=A0A833RDG5_9POAL|nr:hypothetical protein FCM35_KLT17728 [Carex littledalei]